MEEVVIQPAPYPLSSSSHEAGNRWRPVQALIEPPAPYMQELMDTVKKHRDAGLFYTDEVLAAVIKDYRGRLTDEEIRRGRDRVEGGVFGMEVYYARGTIDAQHQRQLVLQAEATLNPTPGMVLGSLIFNDYKLSTGCKIESISGRDIKISGKRGRYTVTFTTNAQSVLFAMERAFEKGKRASATPEPAAPTSATHASLAVGLDPGPLFAQPDAEAAKSTRPRMR